MERIRERLPDLSRVRELYDGMSAVIISSGSVSEFLEHVLTELAPEGEHQVRRAVRKAHQRLGLMQ